MTDLRLVGDVEVERESEPLLDDVFAHLRGSQLEDEAFLRRSQNQREAGVRAVERAIDSSSNSQRLGKTSVILLAASLVAVAAAAGLWFFSSDQNETGRHAFAGTVSEQSGRAMVRGEHGEWNQLSTDLEFYAGTFLRTEEESNLKLKAVGGADIAVSERSLLEFPAQGSENARHRRVRLLHGTIELEVPPLAAEESFAVLAAGHQVIVHGTQFSVTVVEEAAAPCVIVRRGVVEVKAPLNSPAGALSTWLKAGESSGCGLATEEDVTVEQNASATANFNGAEAQDAPVSNESTNGAKPKGTAPSAHTLSSARSLSSSRMKTSQVAKLPDQPSALAEQNRIFQSALSRQREGDVNGARAQLLTLLKLHPDSPLADQARAQLAQLNSMK